ncbi:MAG: efflux RND transporter periplasmic adaptor subunit [Bryobacteraceae bacterium]
MRRTALSLIALPLAALALLQSSCSRVAKVEARTPESAESPTVAVARAETEDLSHGLVLTAEFKPFQEIDVMAKVAGFIKEIRVDAGDRVRQGQLLAILEIPEMTDDIARGKATIDRAESELEHAKDELTRAQSGHEISHLSFKRLAAVSEKRPGLVAQQEIDDAQGKDLVAEAQVSAARSSLSAAQQQVEVNRAELKRVRTMFQYAQVTAPFSGVITKRFADTGSMIQAGTASQTQAMPVVRLSENSLLRLILPVPESAVPTVHIGQVVEVKVPTLDQTFPGKVARFSEKLSMATRTMDTEVDVPNPKLILIPGMYAEVNLTLAQRNKVVTIPITAVDVTAAPETSIPGTQKKDLTGIVMVVTPNNRLETRRISIGLETANKVEVRSGLNEGDMVVIGNRAGLQAGQEVKPKVTKMSASS